MENQVKKMIGQSSQNATKTDKCKLPSYKRVFKPQPTQVSLTQSLFPSKKNSLRTLMPQNGQGCSQFCQTLSNGFSSQFSRPESKRASRKQSSRPQTSKGVRTLTRQRMNYEKWKTAGSSKSMYQQFKEPDGKQDMGTSQVRIVLNTRQKKQKQKSIYGQKFKTQLSDDFLCLFAD